MIVLPSRQKGKITTAYNCQGDIPCSPVTESPSGPRKRARHHFSAMMKQSIFSLAPRSFVLILPAILASCASQGGFAHLDPIAPLNPIHGYDPYAPQSPLSDSVAASWTANLKAEFANKDFFKNMDANQSASDRNSLIYELIALSDYRFSRYESDLVLGKAKRDTFTDISMFGLNSAASLMTPGSATQIVSAIAAGLGFSRSNIEKNFFQNQATPALIDRMEVLRKAKYNEIIPNLSQSYSDYPIAAALKDVNDYFQAGTMIGALKDIKQNTAIQDIEMAGGSVKPPPVHQTPTPPTPPPSPKSTPHPNSTPKPHNSATPDLTDTSKAPNVIALRAWWKPNGIADEDRTKKFNEWLATNEDGADIASFLRNPIYKKDWAKARAALVPSPPSTPPSIDPDVKALRDWLKPNGTADADHTKKFNEWLSTNENNVDVVTFLHDPIYKKAWPKARAALVPAAPPTTPHPSAITDPDAKALFDWWKPDGVANPDHTQKFNTWLATNQAGLDITSFLMNPLYKKDWPKAKAVLVH